MAATVLQIEYYRPLSADRALMTAHRWHRNAKAELNPEKRALYERRMWGWQALSSRKRRAK